MLYITKFGTAGGEIMKRKVIQIAESTELISLPRKWALKYNVLKGDELDVEEQGNKLVVSTGKDSEGKKCNLDLRNQPKLKRRSICAAYLKGYDEVEIFYDAPEYVQIVQSVIPEFTGYDIVKQDKNSCIIRQISKPAPDEFTNVFNRLFLLIHDTLDTMVNALKKNDLEQLKSIQFREISINKYANFCKRIVNKGMHSSPEHTTAYYFILMNLEFLGDEYKRLSTRLLKENKADKRIMSILEQTNTLFENVYKVFKTSSKAKAVENAVAYDKIEQQVDELFTQPKADHVAYHHIARITQIIIEMQEAMLLMLV
ncbi:hypothetical protein HY489_04265 [Candidatus Woesearchaeota archaeon]|nr:hypothetical protein [Candidatus Woesearchaeota archaeon]